MLKLKSVLSRSFSELFILYLIYDRSFRVCYEDTRSSFRKIAADVLQDSVLGFTLYFLYTANISQNPKVWVAIFADDKAVLTTGTNTTIASINLQSALNQIVHWTKLWCIKLSESKSQHKPYSKKRNLFADNYKSTSGSVFHFHEIPWCDIRCQALLEETCRDKTNSIKHCAQKWSG